MTGQAAGTAHEVFPLMRDTGRAIMLTRGNNTHSGNLSLRDPNDRDVFCITASGSQLGALVPSDVVPVHFSRVSWGDGRASTESTIHRKILSIPGVEAAIHAHYLSAIAVTFDAKDVENFLLYEGDAQGTEEFSFVPIDRTGAWVLGRVPSGTYVEPVGLEGDGGAHPALSRRVARDAGEGPRPVRSRGLARGVPPRARRGRCLGERWSRRRGSGAWTRGRSRGGSARRAPPRSIRCRCGRSTRPRSGRYDTRDEATIRAFRERALFNFVQGTSARTPPVR